MANQSLTSPDHFNSFGGWYLAIRTDLEVDTREITDWSVTAQHIEDLQDRIEAMVRCNPETGEQWADICAMESVVVAYSTYWGF